MKFTPLVLVLLGFCSHCLATLDKIADIIHDVVHSPNQPIDHRTPTYYPQAAGPYVQTGVYTRPYVVVTGHNQHNRPYNQGSYYSQTGVYYPSHRIQYNPPNSYGVGPETFYDANGHGGQNGYYQGPPPTYRQNGNGYYYNNNGYQNYPPQYRQRNVNTVPQYTHPPRHNNGAAINLNVVI